MDDWLNLTDVAVRMGVSPRTIRRWIHSGKIQGDLRPATHGPQYFIPISQVESIATERLRRRGLRGADELAELVSTRLRAEIDDVHQILKQDHHDLELRRAELLLQRNELFTQLQGLRQQHEQLAAFHAEIMEASAEVRMLVRDLRIWREAAREANESRAVDTAHVVIDSDGGVTRRGA